MNKGMGDGMMDWTHADWRRALRKAYNEKQPPKARRNISLPNALTITRLNPDTIKLSMTAEGVCSNVQTDAAAFESWAMALKLWLGRGNGVDQIVLTWPHPKGVIVDGRRTTAGLHYERFLYRVHIFRRMFKDWFNVDPSCEQQLADSDAIHAPSLWLNAASDKRGKTLASSGRRKNLPEHELEAQLVRSGYFRDAMQLNDHARRQFPVGLFNTERPSNKSRIFTGGKSAIDMIGVTNDGTFIVFELKALGNIPAGALSELLLYTALVREAADEAARIKFYGEPSWAADVKNCKRVSGVLLADKFHPLLEHERLIPVLNEGAERAWGKAKPVSFDRVRVDRKQWLRP